MYHFFPIIVTYVFLNNHMTIEQNLYTMLVMVRVYYAWILIKSIETIA